MPTGNIDDISTSAVIVCKQALACGFGALLKLGSCSQGVTPCEGMCLTPAPARWG